MAEPQKAPDGEVLPDFELSADATIAECVGDIRAAVIAILKELALTRVAMSSGFSRGYFQRRWDSDDVEAQR